MSDIKLTCDQWLSAHLKQRGNCLCDAVRDAAKKQGYSSKELKEARKKLRVKTWHQFDEDGVPKIGFGI